MNESMNESINESLNESMNELMNKNKHPKLSGAQDMLIIFIFACSVHIL